MTVRRQKDECFDAPPPTIAAAVRAVLCHTPPYRATTETEKDCAFKTNVKPSWWLLGTDMSVKLQPSASGTRVVSTIESQWFICGDVFDYYNQYLRDFFTELEMELGSHRA